MDADQPFKALFPLRPRGLFGLLGPLSGRVLGSQVVELPASKRTVDTVLFVRLGGETYIRHVEVEMRYRRGLERRLFEYATRLGAHFRLPVLTTVVFVRRAAPAELAYRETIGGRIVHEWRFDVLRLWALDPEELLARGPGAAALVGRAERSSAEHVRRAAQVIERSTQPPKRNDLLYVLQALCGERYTSKELAEMIPREAVMASGMFASEFRKARAEGRAEERATSVRVTQRTCLDVVKHLHPAAFGRLAPTIEACEDLLLLGKWTLAATRLSEGELVRLVTGARQRKPVSSRRRAPQPSRRSASRRRG